jgi:hypothetical protein
MRTWLSPNRLRTIGDVEHDRHSPLPAARTFQAAFELIQRKLLAARPHQRLHVELGRGLALNLAAARARFGPGPATGIAPARATRASRPLPGWSQTCEQRENLLLRESRLAALSASSTTLRRGSARIALFARISGTVT